VSHHESEDLDQKNPVIWARYCHACKASHLNTEKCPKKPEKETAKPQKAGVGSDLIFFE
jgi:hypothetical protein